MASRIRPSLLFLTLIAALSPAIASLARGGVTAAPTSASSSGSTSTPTVPSISTSSSAPAPPTAAPAGGAECPAEARSAVEECIANVGPEPECHSYSDAVLTRCHEAGNACLGACERRGEVFRQACLDGGGDPAACEHDAIDLRRGCRQLCLTPSDCVARAEQHARVVVHACLETGKPEEECKRLGRLAFEVGVERCQRACPRPPTACEQECQRKAEADFRACIDGGGNEPDCRARARSTLGDCLRTCPPPRAPACIEACRNHAEADHRECVEAGGSPADCEARSHRLFEGCRSRCDPRAPCRELCLDRARTVFEQCLASGGSEPDCRRRVESALHNCLETCNRQ